MNYRFEIAYDGSRYEGWQRQKKTEKTIQGKIEAVLSRMEERPVEIQGAGRTDAGVHALCQTANARLDSSKEPEEIRRYLNRYLPEDIEILKVSRADDRFHSRFGAVGKRYVYRIGTDDRKDVFRRKYLFHLGEELDTDAMQRAAARLAGTHDFRSFCGNPRMKKSTVRTITRLEVVREEHQVKLVFEGDGFLQYMIRILAGTLMEVGQHLRPADSMEEILAAMDRTAAGPTAPACGLCLERVFYPEDIRRTENKEDGGGENGEG